MWSENMLGNTQVKQILQKLLKAKVVSLLSLIFGSIMLVSGLLLVTTDIVTVESDSLRQVSLASVSTIEQTMGFPLPSYEFVNNSLTAIGIVTWIVGFDLFTISFGLIVQSKIARWVALITFILAAFFDFTYFLLQGLIGAPVAFVGIFINGFAVYVLLKDHRWFTEK